MLLSFLHILLCKCNTCKLQEGPKKQSTSISPTGFDTKPFNSNSRPRVSFQADRLLGLPELPDQPEEAPRNTPIESLQPGGINLDYGEEEEDDTALQLLPPREASQSVAKFRKDPEQPTASLQGKKIVPYSDFIEL